MVMVNTLNLTFFPLPNLLTLHDFKRILRLHMDGMIWNWQDLDGFWGGGGVPMILKPKWPEN